MKKSQSVAPINLGKHLSQISEHSQEANTTTNLIQSNFLTGMEISFRSVQDADSPIQMKAAEDANLMNANNEDERRQSNLQDEDKQLKYTRDLLTNLLLSGKKEVDQERQAMERMITTSIFEAVRQELQESKRQSLVN